MSNLRLGLVKARQFLDDIEEVIDNMIYMNTVIGNTWKWPDAESCLLYAATESAEFVEAYLFATRPDDSRNNKVAANFDAAVELFDVSMMLLRAQLISNAMLSGSFVNAKTDVMEALESIVINHTSVFVNESLAAQYTDVPYRLMQHIVVKVLPADNLKYDPSPALRCVAEIYCSNLFESTPYIQIAREKLDKILHKNLAKQQAQIKQDE